MIGTLRRVPWRVLVGIAAGAGLLLLYLRRYPPPWPVPPSFSGLDPAKLAAAGRALLALFVLNLAALGASRPLAPLWRGARAGLALTLRQALGLFGLAHGVLALGLVGWLSPRALAAFTAIAALFGAPELVRALRSRGAAPPVPRIRAWVWIGAGLALSALSAFVPLYGWDALTYHLALPERFLRTGRISVDPFSIFSTFPLLTEMLYALGLVLDGPALAKLINLELGALLLGALVALCSCSGRTAAFYAAVCLLADPLFLWETTVVYSDLALAFVAVLIADAVLDWEARPSRALALRAALLAGFCAAIRYPGAFVPLAFAIAVGSAGRRPARERLLFAGGLCLGAAVGVGPWLLRNLRETGTLSALGVFDPVYQRQMVAFHESIGMGKGLLDLLAAPWNVTLRNTPGLYSDSFGYQIGPLYLLAIALCVASGRARREDRILWLAAGGLFVAWFYSAQEARYLLPCLALLAILGGAALQRLADQVSSFRLRWALFAAPAVAVVAGQLWIWRETGPAFRMAFGDIPWQTIERTPAEDVGSILRGLPRREDLGVLLLFEAQSWSFRGLRVTPYHTYQGSPVLLAVHRALAAGSLCRWLGEQGVTHIVVNQRTLDTFHPEFVEGYSAADYEGDLRLLEAFLRSSTDLVANVRGTLLVALRSGQCREPRSTAESRPGP